MHYVLWSNNDIICNNNNNNYPTFKSINHQLQYSIHDYDTLTQVRLVDFNHYCVRMIYDFVSVDEILPWNNLGISHTQKQTFFSNLPNQA